MRKSEWALVAIAYVCALVAGFAITYGLRVDVGVAAVVAAIVGIQTAAWLHHHHDATAAPLGLRTLVGVMLAALFAAVTLPAQWRFELMPLPRVSIPMDLIGTFLGAILLMNLFGKTIRTPASGRPLGRRAWLTMAAVALAVAVGCVAWASVARKPKLVDRDLPGLTIAVPAWASPSAARNQSLLYERGEFKLDDPAGHARFISIRWETGDLPDELLDNLWREMGLTVRSSEAVTVAGHPGRRRYVDAPAGQRVALTTWNCPQDGRWIWVLTFLDEPKEKLLATHQAILASVRCHTQGARKPAQPRYALFLPPPGWQRNEELSRASGGIAVVGPRGELVVLSAARAGRLELLSPQTPADAIAGMMKALYSLRSLDTQPAARTVTDPQGVARIIWSCSGRDQEGVVLQIDLMFWYCAGSDATFGVSYLTQGPHDPAEATRVLLGATCPP
jgi:hypothetical protein